MIRRAAVSDIPHIISIAKKSWDAAYCEILSAEQIDYMLQESYSDDVIREQIEGGKIVFLLYVKDEKPVGFAAYELDCEVSGTCKIHKLYILPETQGLGVGKALISEIESILTKNGNYILTLSVNKHNKALHFYERMGFLIAYSEIIVFGPGYVRDDYVMEKMVG